MYLFESDMKNFESNMCLAMSAQSMPTIPRGSGLWTVDANRRWVGGVVVVGDLGCWGLLSNLPWVGKRYVWVRVPVVGIL